MAGAARDAGLQYTDPSQPGIRRLRIEAADEPRSVLSPRAIGTTAGLNADERAALSLIVRRRHAA